MYQDMLNHLQKPEFPLVFQECSDVLFTLLFSNVKDSLEEVLNYEESNSPNHSPKPSNTSHLFSEKFYPVIPTYYSADVYNTDLDEETRHELKMQEDFIKSVEDELEYLFYSFSLSINKYLSHIDKLERLNLYCLVC